MIFKGVSLKEKWNAGYPEDFPSVVEALNPATRSWLRARRVRQREPGLFEGKNETNDLTLFLTFVCSKYWLCFQESRGDGFKTPTGESEVKLLLGSDFHFDFALFLPVSLVRQYILLFGTSPEYIIYNLAVMDWSFFSCLVCTRRPLRLYIIHIRRLVVSAWTAFTWATLIRLVQWRESLTTFG